MTAGRWPWCRRGSTPSPPTAQSCTSPWSVMMICCRLIVLSHEPLFYTFCPFQSVLWCLKRETDFFFILKHSAKIIFLSSNKSAADGSQRKLLFNCQPSATHANMHHLQRKESNSSTNLDLQMHNTCQCCHLKIKAGIILQAHQTKVQTLRVWFTVFRIHCIVVFLAPGWYVYC